ncbi:hypothetical protein CL629_03645 [bacterium]|nr:hypothetical protein [bacterium]|tara:strand:- start:10055 stop:11017 length:963 start_codon:yes stop_codon:yes gene_type:complete
MENPVRTSTHPIIQSAAYVSINQKQIEKIAVRWAEEGMPEESWNVNIHLDSKNEKALLTYQFLLDTLNFCFWNKEEERWYIEHQGKKEKGYNGAALSFKKFFKEHPDKATFEYLQHVDTKEFEDIFQGGENLYFLKERQKMVQGVSRKMVEEYAGDPKKFIEDAKGECSKLVQKIVQELPSFNDEVIYKGEKIYFWKRAQILVGDIWGALGGEGVGALQHMGWLTAFADYKIPQILRHWNVFEYEKTLEEKIEQQDFIPQGSREEIEIRSATIWAVEYLRDALEKYGVEKNAFEIDWILWNKSKEGKLPNPHHLTKTIHY